MTSPRFGLAQLDELRDRTTQSFVALSTSFRFDGMPRALSEEERVAFSRFAAVVMTLRSLDPAIINLDALDRVLPRHLFQAHSNFDSLFADE